LHRLLEVRVTVIQSFTATGDWVCPIGVTEVDWLIGCVLVEVAAEVNSDNNGSGGGGAGGFRDRYGSIRYRRRQLTPVTVGAG
jgi:hypothetical protein